jgi:hypothetical protein
MSNITNKEHKENMIYLKNTYNLNDGYIKKFELIGDKYRKILYDEFIFFSKKYHKVKESDLFKALLNRYFNAKFYHRWMNYKNLYDFCMIF